MHLYEGSPSYSSVRSFEVLGFGVILLFPSVHISAQEA